MNTEINDQLVIRYKDLDETAVKKLTLTKWKNTLIEEVDSDHSRVARDLADRISLLGQRYDEVLSALSQSAQKLDKKVYAHLTSMGVVV